MTNISNDITILQGILIYYTTNNAFMLFYIQLTSTGTKHCRLGQEM